MQHGAPVKVTNPTVAQNIRAATISHRVAALRVRPVGAAARCPRGRPRCSTAGSSHRSPPSLPPRGPAARVSGLHCAPHPAVPRAIAARHLPPPNAVSFYLASGPFVTAGGVGLPLHRNESATVLLGGTVPTAQSLIVALNATAGEPPSAGDGVTARRACGVQARVIITCGAVSLPPPPHRHRHRQTTRRTRRALVGGDCWARSR